MIKKFNCTACVMGVKLSEERFVVCENCKKEFDTSTFNLNTKEEPLAVFSFENNDK